MGLLDRSTIRAAAALVAGVAGALGLGACGDDGAATTPAANVPAATVPATTSAPATAPGATTAPSAPTTTSPATTAPATTAANASVVEVSYVGGSITGGGRRSVPRNSTVTIRVTSDVADEVHVHSYDKTFNIAPGSPGTVSFVADRSGIFEVELHKKKLKLFDLEVK